ncbi:hypothetical protein QCI42_21860 [Bacillus fungorum]
MAVRRQGWDITNVDAFSSLVNNQTSATVRFVTNGDGYAAAGFGVQIDATGPIINPVKSVDKTVAGECRIDNQSIHHCRPRYHLLKKGDQ